MNAAPSGTSLPDFNPYRNPARMRRIFVCVLTIHILIVAVPCLYVYYLEHSKPKVVVIRAALVNLPKGNSLDAPKEETQEQPPSPEPLPPVSEPGQKMPDFPDLAPLHDVKPLPELPPEPEPPAQPVKVPEKSVKVPEKVPDKPVKIPVKVPEKPVKVPEKPVKVPEKPVKVPEKPVKVPEKPSKKYLTAEDIAKARGKKPRIVKTQTDPAAEARARARAKAVADANAKARADAEAASRRAATERGKLLAEAANAVKVYGSPLGGEQGTPATTEFYDYLDKLTAILRQRWKEPKSIELNARRLEVKLVLRIAADGTVEAKEFTPSGNRIMDQSVNALLEKINVVPKPPHAMTVPVTLRVSE